VADQGPLPCRAAGSGARVMAPRSFWWWSRDRCLAELLAVEQGRGCPDLMSVEQGRGYRELLAWSKFIAMAERSSQLQGGRDRFGSGDEDSADGECL
jgi:hypothetical protein